MAEEPFDEQDCLRRIAAGDESAVRRLLHQFHPFVLKIVRAHLPRRVSEDDLVQMIFIKVFQNLPTYRGNVPVHHWISRIAVNTCFNALKAEKIRPEWRLSDFSSDVAEGIERLARAEETTAAASDEIEAAKELLNALLAQLSPEDRLIITLLHIEELSVDEIHARTGLSRAVIKVRAFRARGRMKKMLSKSQALAFAQA
jgi:RNA polymerase sigma-70 factor (ECF subfamily)